MADTLLDIISDALFEINAYKAGEQIPGEDATFCQRKANSLLDEWAARKAYAYATTFIAYTLTANHAPHLIGPGLTSPDFAATQRPVRIEGATLILNNVSPNVDLPLTVRDKDWWNYQRVKTLLSNVPTDLYYEPKWPNGELNLWPNPNFAYGLRLESWVLLTQFVNLTDAFSFPPAFKKAFTLNLALSLCSPFEKQPLPTLVKEAADAKKAYQGNNLASPRMATIDSGQPLARSGGVRGDFNWQDGSVNR